MPVQPEILIDVLRRKEVITGKRKSMLLRIFLLLNTTGVRVKVIKWRKVFSFQGPGNLRQISTRYLSSILKPTYVMVLL